MAFFLIYNLSENLPDYAEGLRRGVQGSFAPSRLSAVIAATNSCALTSADSYSSSEIVDIHTRLFCMSVLLYR
jgi:hypothetical protein